MAVNPIPIVITCSIAYGAQVLLLASGVTPSVDYPDWDNKTGLFGFFSNALDIIGEAISFIWQFSTFQISGLPWYIGIPIGIGCLGTLTWSLIGTIRGN